MNTRTPNDVEPSPSEGGFAILAVMVMVGVFAMVATTFSRHVIIHERSSTVSEAAFEANEIIDSQIDFVLQSQNTGEAVDHEKLVAAVASGSVGVGGTAVKHDLEFDYDSVGSDRMSLQTKVLSTHGTGATRLIEAGRAPRGIGSDPDSLPQVDSEVLSDLLTGLSIPRFTVANDTIIEDAELNGLVIVKSGAELTLRDVILEGSIISHNAIKGYDIGSFHDATAPKVIIDGSVRIRSGDFLEDVAVLMPDGVFETADSDSRLIINGDVVAHRVVLEGEGATNGNIASADDAVIGSGMMQVGSGRGSDTWSDALDTQDSYETTFFAIVPRKVDLQALGNITAYQFPYQIDKSVSEAGDGTGDDGGSEY